ncbi:LexA repressor [Salinisphaera sp. PC39]|uniref:transcriptional repressor LexA n=1 Tax=Salinisphaera sp. PC39 TaxID=1304156 RepID=UPI00333F94D2
MELTPKQARVLDFIRRHAAANGIPPTRAEIAAGLGFASPNAAQAHLKALARRGAIELVSGASRGIRLPEEASAGDPEEDGPELPVVGRVAAGAPVLAVENVESRQRVPPGLFSPAPDYLLRVRGASMIEAGILDGDLLAVHATAEAADGRIAVVRVEDEVTVKRLKRDGHRLTLLPANPDYEPIEIDLRRQDAVIEGVAVGVLRRV